MLTEDAEVSEVCPKVYSLSGTPAAGAVPVEICYQKQKQTRKTMFYKVSGRFILCE